MYLSGQVAERFLVRNSGAVAVVEGVGDHGCEYMTGGRAIILGEVGRNFGAGMSGGIAYIYNPNDTFKHKVNPSMLDLDPMDALAEAELKTYIQQHSELTGSNVAQTILENWKTSMTHFIKVIPRDYKCVLQQK
jgi:glutamate synthase (NADPH/NADH) large chain